MTAANVPTGAHPSGPATGTPASAAAGHPDATMPMTDYANVPSVPGDTPSNLTGATPVMPAASGAPGVSGAAGGGHIPATPGKSVYETNHAKDGRRSPSLLQKLKPATSTEKLKTASGPPPGTSGSTLANVPTGKEGPLIVDELDAIRGPGSGIRFSNTAHTIPPADATAAHDATVPGPGHPADSKASNKLKKKPSQSDMAAHSGQGAGGDIHAPGAAGHTTPGSTGVNNIPAVPVSGPASAPGAPGTPGSAPVASTAHGSIPGVPPSGAGSAGKKVDIPILDKIVLPDGTEAYVRSGVVPSFVPPASATAPVPTSAPIPAPAATGLPSLPTGAPSGGKKDKSKDKMDAAAEVSGALGEASGSQANTPAGNHMSGGHCAMCCPSAPRDASGRPIFPCAHQDGLSGPSAMDRAQAAHASTPGMAASKKKGESPGAPPTGPIADLPAGPGEEAGADVLDKPGPGKLKKGKAPSAEGLSPEEEAMEEARKLAGELASLTCPRKRGVRADFVAKQKAAAESAGMFIIYTAGSS